MKIAADPMQLWNGSPVPQFVMDRSTIRRANAAFWALLGYTESELIDREQWEELLFADPAQSYKFFRFIHEGRRRHMDVEFRARDGRTLFLRVEHNLLEQENDAGVYLISLTNLTDIREDSEAMRAGYDEFVRVTTELEDALGTIEKQNDQLEKQKQTLENELSIARKVQSQLFTRDFSRFQLVRCGGFYEAMENLGGDMWEFYETGRDFYGVIGDVMGHGVAASLISIAAKTLFKKHFEERGRERMLDFQENGGLNDDLGAITTALNEELLEITRGNYYITLCMIRIDRSYRMQYLTAGHPPLFVVRRGSEKGRLIYTSQPMVGIFSGVTYQAQNIQLNPGDRVLMYTDCLLESFDPAGNALNLQDAAGLIRGRPESTPQAIIQDLLDYRSEYSGTTELPDDLALVLVEIPE